MALSRVNRRTVIRTTAWATPAVLVATAAPAHAVSAPSGWDLALVAPQMGSGAPYFSPDFTQEGTYNDSVACAVVNNGTVVAPAGSTLMVTVDKRMLVPTGFSARPGDTDVAMPAEDTTTNGNLITISATIPFAVEPGDVYTTGVVVRVEGDWVGAGYPNDGFADPQSGFFTLIPPAGDADQSNHSFPALTFGPLSPVAGVWGFVPQPTWADYTAPDGTALQRVTRIDAVSTGPTGIEAGSSIAFNNPTNSVLSVTSVTIGGEDAADSVDIAVGPQTRIVINVPLPATTVVVVEVAYDDSHDDWTLPASGYWDATVFALGPGDPQSDAYNQHEKVRRQPDAARRSSDDPTA